MTVRPLQAQPEIQDIRHFNRKGRSGGHGEPRAWARPVETNSTGTVVNSSTLTSSQQGSSSAALRDRINICVMTAEIDRTVIESCVLAAGPAVAVFCIWLGIRIYNRRERWAKRLAVWVALALIAYPISFGPVFGLLQGGKAPEWLIGNVLGWYLHFWI
jgi:hypothetical protein